MHKSGKSNRVSWSNAELPSVDLPDKGLVAPLVD